MPSRGYQCGAVRLTIDAADPVPPVLVPDVPAAGSGYASHRLFYPAVAVATDGPIAWYSRAAESGATIDRARLARRADRAF